ncbi:hypothetical protein [Chitinophaga sp. CB10]|uniref:hypothetical protein n=1 Tax=Chitinophaga sp. CB10 TaxID=1891659 RepID=UPI0025C120AB|nr:hypothetical protein [Chitinophaga sp. CB10]
MVYKFVVSKKGYGVAIFIDVDEIRSPVLLENDLLVDDRIYLRINHPIPFLSENDVDKYITKAIKDLSSEIYGKINDSTVCFFIRGLDTNPIYFQEEGLYCAMRGWLVQNYKLEVPSIPTELDEKNRRFVFDI